MADSFYPETWQQLEQSGPERLGELNYTKPPSPVPRTAIPDGPAGDQGAVSPTATAVAEPPAAAPAPTPEFTLGVTKGTAAEPSPPSAPVDPAVAESALHAMLNPDRVLRGLDQMERDRDAASAASAEAIATAKVRAKMRANFEQDAQDAMVAYREALGEKRPDIPELKKLPGVPDIKVRPWLDPEGKDALSVIAQTLGMLATGVGGLVIGAPKTAIKLFKDAADAWRQDEIDHAESSFKQFQTEVQKIQTENQQALTVYDMKDKEYGANQLAKRAAVIAEFDRLKLHDASVAAAMIPYELAIQAHQHALEATAKIINASSAYAGVVTRYDIAQNKMPTNPGGYLGEWQAAEAKLKTETDPEQRKRLEARAAIMKTGYEKLQKDRLDQLVAYGKAQGGVRVAAGQLPKMDDRITMITRMTDRLESLDAAYATLHKAGLLPATASPVSEWFAAAKRAMPGKWTPEALAAKATIETFYPQVIVTEARTVMNEVGARFKGAFGANVEKPIQPYQAWVGIRTNMASLLSEADRTYRGYQRLYQKELGGTVGGGVPEEPAEEGE